MWDLMFNYNILLSMLIHLLYTDILFKFCLLIPLSLFLYYYSTPKELKDKGLYTYKIFNHKINLFLITFYISIYLVFLLYIRTQYLNKDIILLDIIQNIKQFYNGTKVINILLLLSLFLLCLYLLMIVHISFRKELIKRHLVLFYNKKQDQVISSDYIYLLNIYGFMNKIILVAASFSVKYHIGNRIFQYFRKCWRYLLLSFPTHFIISFFFYELLFNNFILSSTFNHALYLYIFYTFYKRISTYYSFTESFLNHMIYNMYYSTNTVLYVNMPKAWEDVIYQYVSNGLQRNREKNPVPSLDYNLGEFELTIDAKHTYHSRDSITYTNNQGDYFIEDHKLTNNQLSTSNVPEKVVPHDIPHEVEQLNQHPKKTENIQDSEHKEAVEKLLKQIKEYRKDDNQENK